MDGSGGSQTPQGDKPYPNTLARLRLRRLVDVSGVSGTGVVAYGVRFPDGSVVLCWDTKVTSKVYYNSVEDMVAITGHGGNTVVEWIDSDKHYFTVQVDKPWVIEHADDCRQAGALSSCPYTRWAASADALEVGIGRWVMEWNYLAERMALDPA